MTQHRILLGVLVFITGQFGSVSTQSQYVCKTFGGGTIKTFNETLFYVKSTCPVTLTHFSYGEVDCFISVQGVSLPYDQTYQSVYTFGIYTKLRSKVLPLSVIWYSFPEGVTSLWIQLDLPLVDEMTGMCGRLNSDENRAQLLYSNIIRNEKCITEDNRKVTDTNKTCQYFASRAMECVDMDTFVDLCEQNIYNVHNLVKCSFFEEFLQPCDGVIFFPPQSKLREITKCAEPACPGDLKFQDQGPAFPPTCSNPKLQTEFNTSTCLPQDGLVLNDRAEGYHSVKVQDCPCVHMRVTYAPGKKISSKCQTCECINGKWNCSPNTCVPPCAIEGWSVTTFDGKQYSLPGKCTYVAAMGLNWTVTIQFSDVTIGKMYLDVFQERYTFSLNSVQLGGNDITITDLSKTVGFLQG
ncbi:hypothetical protein AMELA_G00179950 [Ameiurus melas]|uniref:VWFC domain-containing protein n=1 Tax=Ameiurus melas TaxID=219545 RepID=A0A7J6AA05_AMEME|nr:hypothetical protein AMELA_G00179950 [Ameiurus melas]